MSPASDSDYWVRLSNLQLTNVDIFLFGYLLDGIFNST